MTPIDQSTSTHEDERQALRHTINARRTSLSPSEREHAAEGLQQQFLSWSQRQSANNGGSETTLNQYSSVAGFIAVRGEIDVAPILAALRESGTITCLPVIQSATGDYAGDFLKFGAYDGQTPMRQGQYRIPVPDIDDSELRDAQSIDLVLVPLVAFDPQGNRLGMGGGFYDRTFEYRTHTTWQQSGKRQAFIGVAHEFQRVDTLPVEPWDVPLDAIITDTTCYFPQESP